MSMYSTRQTRYRRLRAEQLEHRLMLAADAFMFQNPLDALDVNNDSIVNPQDVLAVIDQLNGGQSAGTRQFSDTSGDNQVTPIDALGVIYQINNQDEIPLTAADRVEILVDRINEFPQQVAAHWASVTDNVTRAIEQHRQMNDALRAQLDEFLAFDSENREALDLRLEEIGYTKQAIDVYLETQVVGYSENIASINEPGTPVDPGDPVDGNLDFDFYGDFDWGTVDNPEAGMDQLMEQIQLVGASIELPSVGELDPDVSQLVDMFEQSGIDLVDFVEQDQSASPVEQWYLNDGDIGDLLDSLDDDPQAASDDFGALVDQYFGDEQVFIEYLEDMADDLVIGDLIASPLAGAEGAGDIPYVVTDGEETWQLVIGNDVELQSLIESYAGENVLVDGDLVSGNDDVLDVISIVRTEVIRELANDLAWVDARLANILLGLLD